MPYFRECQIPTSSPFGDGDGKCGKPVPEGSDFPACQFHLQHIFAAPENPQKSFPDSAVCVICKSQVRSIIPGGICCRIEEHKDNITLSALIQLFHEDNSPPNKIFMSCDLRLINALKDFLAEKVPSLPRTFTVSFDRFRRIITIHEKGTRRKLHTLQYSSTFQYVRDYPNTTTVEIPPPYTVEAPSQGGGGTAPETMEFGEMTYTIHVVGGVTAP